MSQKNIDTIYLVMYRFGEVDYPIGSFTSEDEVEEAVGKMGRHAGAMFVSEVALHRLEFDPSHWH